LASRCHACGERRPRAPLARSYAAALLGGGGGGSGGGGSGGGNGNPIDITTLPDFARSLSAFLHASVLRDHEGGNVSGEIFQFAGDLFSTLVAQMQQQGEEGVGACVFDEARFARRCCHLAPGMRVPFPITSTDGKVLLKYCARDDPSWVPPPTS
jgi:hypothetical protein